MATTTDIDAVASTLSKAFYALPVTKYLSVDPTPEQCLDHFKQTATSFIQGGAYVIQAHDHEAVALWFEPGFELPPPDDDKRLTHLLEFSEQKLLQHLRSNKGCWHLVMLARDPDSQTKGAVSAVVKPILKRALEKGIPVVLEAASEYSRGVYEHWGFVNYGEFRVGVGEVNERGLDEEGGAGVPLWCMIYNNGK